MDFQFGDLRQQALQIAGEVHDVKRITNVFLQDFQN